MGPRSLGTERKGRPQKPGRGWPARPGHGRGRVPGQGGTGMPERPPPAPEAETRAWGRRADPWGFPLYSAIPAMPAPGEGTSSMTLAGGHGMGLGRVWPVAVPQVGTCPSSACTHPACASHAPAISVARAPGLARASVPMAAGGVLVGAGLGSCIWGQQSRRVGPGLLSLVAPERPKWGQGNPPSG